MIAGQFGVDSLIEFAVTGAAGVQRLKAVVVFGKLLFDNIGLDRDAQVIGLAREVGRNVVIPVLFERVIT